MKNNTFDFEKLKVYQKTLDYIDSAYKITKSFPQSELYGLTSQLLRASLSIALNIAEGSGGTNAQFINYLRTSRSSLRECVVCFTIAKRQKYINEKVEDESRITLVEISKMISGLISSLK